MHFPALEFHKGRSAALFVTLALVSSFTAAPTLQASGDWPQFRGPDGQGHVKGHGLPLKWSESDHVKWKTAILGEGWSSPVVLDEQIWLTTAVDGGKSLRAVGLDQATGKVLHDVEVFPVENPEFKHALNSYASPTPVLEKGRVYVSFGDYGNACLSTETGKPIWKSKALKLDHENGPGSSPIVYKDLFILHCDGTNTQYIAALNKHSGELAWKAERSGRIDKAPPMRKAYCTPLVINVNGRDELISPAAEHVYGYDPLTGKELWVVKYPGFSNVPRPVFGNGLVYVCTGFGKPEIWAIRPGGRGDVTQSHVAWKMLKGAPAKPSPVLVGDRVYMVSDEGIASCLNALTGEQLWQERLGGAYSASPIFAEGRIYFFSHEGKATVIAPSDNFQVLAESKLDTGFMASPAVVGRAMYLRTKTHLYRVEL